MDFKLRFFLNKASINIWILTATVLIALALRVKYFVGIYSFDSYFYAQLSYFLSKLDLHSFFFNNNGFFAIGRFVLYIPTAFFYRALGITDTSSVLFVLIMSLVSIVVIYLLGRKLLNEKAGLLAALLLAIFPLDVFYSTQYLPDGLVPVFHSLAALTFLYAEDEKNQRKSLILYFLVGVLIGLSQLIRENAFVFLGVLVVYVVFKRKFTFKYLIVLLGGFAIFILANVFFLIGTGDLFFQYKQIFSTFLSARQRIEGNNWNVPQLFGFTKILLFNRLFSPFGFLIALSALYSFFYRRRQVTFILIWFFTLLFYLEVLSRFHGLTATNRYLTPMEIPILLLVSFFLIEVYKNLKIKPFWAALFLVFLLLFSVRSVKVETSARRNQVWFVTYRSLASELKGKEISQIYMQVLRHKGYIFNYVFGFEGLNYNSFQRNNVEGTPSLLKDWDGKSLPPKGSYVVVDSKESEKLVRLNWDLVSRKFNTSLYYIEK